MFKGTFFVLEVVSQYKGRKFPFPSTGGGFLFFLSQQATTAEEQCCQLLAREKCQLLHEKKPFLKKSANKSQNFCSYKWNSDVCGFLLDLWNVPGGNTAEEREREKETVQPTVFSVLLRLLNALLNRLGQK